MLEQSIDRPPEVYRAVDFARLGKPLHGLASRAPFHSISAGAVGDVSRYLHLAAFIGAEVWPAAGIDVKAFTGGAIDHRPVAGKGVSKLVSAVGCVRGSRDAARQKQSL